MSGRGPAVLAMVESNTTGTGRLFAIAARSAGLRPLVIAAEPLRYPWLATDGVAAAVADTDDPAAVVAAVVAAGPDGIAGIITSSEYSVGIAAAAAARLGLPGPAVDAVSRCRDKRHQRAVLGRGGLPVPRSRSASGLVEAVAAGDHLGFPVICKPVDGTGSRGVRLCPDETDLARHAARLLGAPVDERGRRSRPAVLVEEYVAGPEVSVETFGPHVVGVTAKHLGPHPHFVETGHDFPLGGPLAAEVAALARRAVDALGVGWGPAHTEVRLGRAGPVIIEVNPRLAGGRIPVLVRLATGVDLLAATVALAISGRHDLPPAGLGAASIRFVVAHRAGRVLDTGDLTAAADTPGVVDVAVSAAVGDEVGGTGSFADRIGHVMTAGRQTAETASAAEAALARLGVVVGPRGVVETQVPVPTPSVVRESEGHPRGPRQRAGSR